MTVLAVTKIKEPQMDTQINTDQEKEISVSISVYLWLKKPAVAQVPRFIKGKSTIQIARQFFDK